MNTIHEVMEYGYIVAHDEDMDLLVTVNGAYYNLWCGNLSGKYECTDCRAFDNGFDGLHGQGMVKVVEGAERYLEDVLNEAADDGEEE